VRPRYQDQTLHEVLVSEDDRDLAQRCTQLSVLSMSLAMELQLDATKVRQVGTAALLHDIALFGLDEAQRVPSPQMTSASRGLFRNHPLLADRLLEPIRGIDLNVRAVVRQVHEQLDGSWFPIRLTSSRIHNLARLVNIADAYLTLLEPGLGREGIIPADAMAYLVHHTCEGRFDPAAMKALLQTLSLYPIGSLVELSDRSEARVLRARRGHPQQPVVIRLDALQTIIDLADSPLSIREPLNDASHPRRRLPTHQIGQVMWGLHVA
jgi:HD-GYP domain-containing protein (c-di-GMP phosphodiesterase class II)